MKGKRGGRYQPPVAWGSSPQEIPGDILGDSENRIALAAMRDNFRIAEVVRRAVLARRLLNQERKLLAESELDRAREAEAQEAVDAFRSLLGQGPVDLRTRTVV